MKKQMKNKNTGSGVLVNSQQMILPRKKKPRFVVFTYFYCINTPTMANFKLQT